MRAKIIYYSLEGSTKLIAENISKTLNADIERLIPIKKYPDKGAKKFFAGGKSALFGEKPQLEVYDRNLEYDLLILGTPVWAGTISPPLRTFLSESDLSGKKVALLICSMSGNADRSIGDFKKLQPDCELVDTVCFSSPIKNDTAGQVDKAIRWSEGLTRRLK